MTTTDPQTVSAFLAAIAAEPDDMYIDWDSVKMNAPCEGVGAPTQGTSQHRARVSCENNLLLSIATFQTAPAIGLVMTDRFGAGGVAVSEKDSRLVL